MKIPNFTKTRCLLGLLFLTNMAVAQLRTVTGTIIDERGEPMPFVSVYVPPAGSTGSGTTTDFNGRFSLPVPQNATAIEVSFIGYKIQRVPLIEGTNNYSIRMESEAIGLEQVVIVGAIERRAESFTGSFTTVQMDELKQMGSQNLIESLKSLDPSFIVMENMAMGADPNTMPTIEVRGQTAINIADVDDIFRHDPNQPLFILDGFETDLQKIVDLDFNRVASVTLLKDAASTAFYGSRAANGVLVVETIRGEAGRYRFFYTGDFSLQVTDLSSYNMMNAKEKLEFERLSGRFLFDGGRTQVHTFQQREIQEYLDWLYAFRLSEVNRGVNSFWMSEPLQVPFIQRHSLRFTGGSGETVIAGGFSFRDAPGVMKGSKRQSWTGDFDVTYSKGNFSLVNRLGLSGFTSENSPYGAFSTWVNTNPYYRKTDENGEFPRYLDEVRGIAVTGDLRHGRSVPNPLYNAMLNNRDNSNNINVNERLQMIWNFHPEMRLEGSGQVQFDHTTAIRFHPPEHTDFDGVSADRRGLYSNNTRKQLRWLANVMYVWNKRIGDHAYTLNVRGEAAHENSNRTSWSATGYPMGTNGNPSFASQFIDGIPGYTNTVHRRVNALGSVNYGYKNRYLFDGTFRLDGSTAFGSARRYTPFWSTGLGWNAHEESFVRQHRWINQLRFRATIGQTGNQNLGSVISTSVYNFLPGGNEFGPGVLISALGNRYIEWQKTLQANFAVNMSLFNGRFQGGFEVYEKRTTPLVVPVDQVPSAGTNTFPMNVGYLTYRGFEYDVTYGIIRSKDISWRIRVMGAVVNGVYGGLEQKLESLDAGLMETGSLMGFRDGYGPRTLFAVRSLGIDPATGREVFLDRFGEPTFVWNARDRVPVGNEEPDVMGTINSFFTYKHFTLTVILRYSLGADRFNTALYNKVENIGFNQITQNQDRRALYGRWNPENPGVATEFKSISLMEHTPMSSRFLQKENFLAGESIGIMWRKDKRDYPWLARMNMERMTVTTNVTATGGVFRLSNIQRERGTAYPEAYTFNLSVSIAF